MTRKRKNANPTSQVHHNHGEINDLVPQEDNQHPRERSKQMKSNLDNSAQNYAVFSCQTQTTLHTLFSRLFHLLSFFLTITCILSVLISRLLLHYHVDPEDPLQAKRPILVVTLLTVGALAQFFVSTNYAHAFAMKWAELFSKCTENFRESDKGNVSESSKTGKGYNDSKNNSDSASITDSIVTGHGKDKEIQPFSISTHSLAEKIFFVFISITFIYFQVASYLQLISNGIGELRGDIWRVFITRPYAVWICSLVPWGFLIISTWLIRKLVGWMEHIFNSPSHCNSGPESSTANKCPVRRLASLLVLGITLILPFISFIGLNHTIYPEEIHNVVTIHAPANNTVQQSILDLKILQLSDIHLGIFMSKEQLRDITEQTLLQYPDIDLVALTGDFYTVESSRQEDALRYGLEPLKKWTKGRKISFACPGNHDHDVQSRAKRELMLSNTEYLVDSYSVVEVKGHRIQIIGFDYHFLRPEKMAEQFRQFVSQEPNVSVRIVLLHNPSHFKFIPTVDSIPTLVLSGHLHGGQFGLRTFTKHTSEWTVLRMFKMPDFGFYFKSNDGSVHHELVKPIINEDGITEFQYESNHPLVQYVHTGTGFYGLPLRVGTRSERGILTLRIIPHSS